MEKESEESEREEAPVGVATNAECASMIRSQFMDMMRSATRHVNVDMVAMSIIIKFIMSFVSDLKKKAVWKAAYEQTIRPAFNELETRLVREGDDRHVSAAEAGVLSKGREGRRVVACEMMKIASRYGCGREMLLYFMNNELGLETDAMKYQPLTNRMIHAAAFIDRICETPHSHMYSFTFGAHQRFVASELAIGVSMGWLCQMKLSLPFSQPYDWFHRLHEGPVPSGAPPRPTRWVSTVNILGALADGSEKEFRAKVMAMQTQKERAEHGKRTRDDARQLSEGSSMRHVAGYILSLEMSTNADTVLDRLLALCPWQEAFARIGLDGEDVRRAFVDRMEAFVRSAAAERSSAARASLFSEEERRRERAKVFTHPVTHSHISLGTRAWGPHALMPVSIWLNAQRGVVDPCVRGTYEMFTKDIKHATLADICVFAPVHVPA